MFYLFNLLMPYLFYLIKHRLSLIGAILVSIVSLGISVPLNAALYTVTLGGNQPDIPIPPVCSGDCVLFVVTSPVGPVDEMILRVVGSGPGNILPISGASSYDYGGVSPSSNSLIYDIRYDVYNQASFQFASPVLNSGDSTSILQIQYPEGSLNESLLLQWQFTGTGFYSSPLKPLILNTAPSISGIWPASADVGENTSVFVFGSNFTTDGASEVHFNGIRQWLVSPVSTDMLIVRLAPVTADLFGPVTVTTPSGTGTGPSPFGMPATGLSVTGVWPGTATIGEYESIFIFGSEFTTDGSTAVYFNGVRQWMVAPVSSEMLIVRVLGDSLLSGTVTVTTPTDTVNSVEPLEFVP